MHMHSGLSPPQLISFLWGGGGGELSSGVVALCCSVSTTEFTCTYTCTCTWENTVYTKLDGRIHVHVHAHLHVHGGINHPHPPSPDVLEHTGYHF